MLTEANSKSNKNNDKSHVGNIKAKKKYNKRQNINISQKLIYYVIIINNSDNKQQEPPKTSKIAAKLLPNGISNISTRLNRLSFPHNIIIKVNDYYKQNKARKYTTDNSINKKESIINMLSETFNKHN